MPSSNKKVEIKDILLSENYVSAEDMVKAEAFSKRNKVPITDYLFSENIINKDIFGQAMAESFGFPYADLNSNQPSKDQVLKMSESVAKKFNAVVFKDDGKNLIVTTDDPSNKSLAKELVKLFPGKKVSLTYSLKDDILESFVHYRKTLETRFMKIMKKEGSVAPQIFDEIVEDALLLNASDIHLEPQEDELLIRFRVDGVLQEAGRIEKAYYENILNRIKVQAHIRTDEHYSAQDGAIRYEKGQYSADIRVSVVPIADGEKVVMRILSKYVRSFTLSSLGLSKKNEEVLDENAKKPFGMILVVGPTGSGKTTTLYSLLKKISRPEVNVATIEDPVEYKIKGINQIQVNQQTNLTFVQGLRAIVRQDPDIILVGEIRDLETTEIAVNAALTGHLMLSTFHANDAATAIPRLLDMGVEPFLLSSTLELVIAQRLTRKICENCRFSYVEDLAKIKGMFPGVEKYFSGKKATFYKGKGCPSCNNTGYKGRIAIFELIDMTKEMRELTLKRPSSQEIWKLAKRQGSVTIFEDGIEKVKTGVTTLEELLRVASLEN